MKKLKIITSCILVTLFFFGNSVAQTTMIVGDLFEGYDDGTYPNANGWYNLFSGSSAKVVTEKSFWGQKSFKLEGNSNWSRIDVIDVSYGNQIFYKVDIFIPNSTRGAIVGFFQKQGSSAPSYNSIMFRNDGTIYTRGTNENDLFLQNYSANTWYRVRVAIDFSQNKMDVYINDQLRAEGIIPKAKSYCYSFGICTNNFTGSGTSIAYFDNVSVLKTYIPSSSPKALMVTNYYLYDFLSLIDAGFIPTVSDQISSNLSQFNLVYVANYGACNSTTANYLKNYIQNGGGVILMGGEPNIFGMSTISDWFGASSYGNVYGTGMTASTTVSDAVGSGLANGSLILDFGPTFYMNGGATIYNLSQDSYIVAKYSNDDVFAFYHEYQQGRVYYTAGASSPWYYTNQTAYDNFSKLLVAAMKWVANDNHTVSTPNTPNGPASGSVGQTLTFSTGSASCNLGHSVQYRFDWDDGSPYSSWGSSSQSHPYTSTGTYTVKAQARCSVDNSVVSSWSNGKSVTINGGGNIPITPSTAATQQAGAEFDVDIIVGSAFAPVTNLYGVSFELGYSTTYLDYVSYDKSGSFLGSDLLEYVTPDDPNGKVSVGITRKSSSSGVSGYGIIIKIKFLASSTTPNNTQVSFAIHNVTANDPSGNPIILSPGSLTITITSGKTVWPGDTNNDGTVNQADVLPLGLYWNKTGPKRTCHANETQWIEHTASPWTPEAATYADANGDGIVNQADVLVIGLNWGKTHTIAKSFADRGHDPSGKISGMLIPKLTYNAERREVYFDVYAENVTGLFGLAFEVNYPQQDLVFALAEPGDLFSQDHLFFHKDQPGLGRLGIGISQKMGQATAAEKGLVARITFRLLTGESSLEHVSLKIDGLQANDEQGKPIIIQAQACSNPEWSDFAAAPVNQYKLFTNYPNPFNPTTIISYALPKAAHVRIHVFDLTGRLVKTLLDAEQQAGMHSIAWDAQDDAGKEVANGMYICRMMAGGEVLHQKMILAK